MASSVTRSSTHTVRTPARTTRTSSSERTQTPPSSTGTREANRSSFAPEARTQGTTARGSLRQGSSGDAVRSLQDKLRGAGFDPGRSDGKFGPNTERALRDFQQARGLKVDGLAGRRTLAALNGPDRMDTPRAGSRPAPSRPAPSGTGRTDANASTSGTAANGTARLNNQPAGKGMTTGTITVNGRSYQFNSGSRSLYSVPQGTYRVTAHRDRRSEAAFSRGGEGFSFLIEDANRRGSDRMYDARAGRDRSLLRIHPDGGATGTAGCIGIVGDAATMRQFRADMNAELHRNGGSYTLRVQ